MAWFNQTNPPHHHVWDTNAGVSRFGAAMVMIKCAGCPRVKIFSTVAEPFLPWEEMACTKLP